MSVAWVVSANVAPGGASTPFTFGITVSGTNPVLMVGIGLASDTATISGVTWSLGSGTPFEVKTIRVGTAFASVWAIPAPEAGAGTISVSVSEASAYHQAAASVFSGAAQTASVSSTDDADTDSLTTGTGGVTRYLTVTPLNLTADDCSFGLSVNTVAGDEGGFATNDRYKNSSTAVNLSIGDSSGTTDLVASFLDSAAFNWVAIGVRVVVLGTSALSASASDTATISDTPTITFDLLAPSVSDSVTVTGTPTLSLNPSTVGYGALLAEYRNRRVIA